MTTQSINISTFRIKQQINKKGVKGILDLKKLEPTGFINIIAELSEFPYYKKFLIDNPFPKQIINIGRSTWFESSDDIKSELMWHASLFLVYKKELQQFLFNKRTFDQHILNGDFKNAQLMLEQIENDFGYSLWSIESRIKLLELKDGNVAQREYLTTLMKNKNLSAHVRFQASLYASCVDKNYPSNIYRSSLRDFILTSPKAHNNFMHDLGFTLDMLYEGREYNFPEMISRHSKYPLIDRLLKYIRVCQYIVSHNKDQNSIAAVKDSIKILNGNIETNEIKNLSIAIGLTVNNDKPEIKEILQVFDKYTSGDYKGVVDDYNKIRNVYPDRLEVALLYIKSLIFLGITLQEEKPNSLLSFIHTNLYNIT